MKRRTWIKLAAAAATLSLAGAAAAQATYPDRPIRLIVPFPPGGTSDVVGRIFAEALAKQIGQPVVVENRGGAGGTVGSRAVASAAPDGYTLLLGTSSTNGTNPAVYKNLPYDAVKDFTPVTQIIRVPGVIVVNKNFPAKDYASFTALIKGAPGKYSYASSGNGGATHMAMEYYKSLSGLDMMHVPYRGTGPALNDVIAGQVPILWDTAASSMAHIQSGNLRPIVVAAKSRLPQLPDVPTFAEVGLPDYDAEMWNGLLAPAGLPKDVLAKLNDASRKALADKDVQAKYAGVGAYVVADKPEAFAAMIQGDVAKWKKVADFAHISAE
ncbi:ABC transporter substrate-binding protein [Achromobacter xylosoxidans]|uniref:Bug family tripartite tricarboxylate transporter substrate binding protein n=1 Tax=Achromobacter TaxID=222 RepID=UPI000799F0B8|nr:MULTISPECIES: tripartite tricarboxylate transporter substrate binding protein BugE [Achromobacter]KXJ63577.1 ABC transporter substrate-binding protein [Achromobacter xylosoxidans]MCP2513678.1 tripartite tricarboxylate transporter substrate binding protein BugE [Achromobacter mucicolens]MDH1522663.1 tripartite tricarboxylate transporter substrate binding protein BugE [Achromobacter mucicolens]UDG77972.1 tripartite tricarboxylate transporter substrate binding protein BugE [Achromobacter sp. 77